MPDMLPELPLVFETKRLRAFVATSVDAYLFYSLRTNPRVMKYVGFPFGLPITLEDIERRLAEQSGQILDARLVVKLRESGQSIGECKLGSPNQDSAAIP